MPPEVGEIGTRKWSLTDGRFLSHPFAYFTYEGKNLSQVLWAMYALLPTSALNLGDL